MNKNIDCISDSDLKEIFNSWRIWINRFTNNNFQFSIFDKFFYCVWFLDNEIKNCRLRKGRVIAIGTTSVRALEGAFIEGGGRLKPLKVKIDLVIKPGYQFGVVDGLLTNFHLPKSSLLLLVSALIGRKRLLALYAEAIKRQYRFYSYGDAMWIPPEAVI